MDNVNALPFNGEQWRKNLTALNGRFTFKDTIDSIVEDIPKKTPLEKRKVRNSCLSGHRTGEELDCPYCQQALFYTLTSGYHADEPTEEELRQYLLHSSLDTSQKLADYYAVLKYLGLDLQASKQDIEKFLLRLQQIDTLVLWGKNQFCTHFIRHPLTKKMVGLAPLSSGKSALVGQLVAQNPDLRQIYASAVTMGVEGAPFIETKWLKKMGIESEGAQPAFKIHDLHGQPKSATHVSLSKSEPKPKPGLSAITRAVIDRFK